VQSTAGKIQTTDGSHRWSNSSSAVDSSVENVLAVGNPVANWGHFISKCWMKRSKSRCAKDQFTNETWVVSAAVLLVSWIFLESSVLLTQVFFKTPFCGIPWGCTHVLCGSPTFTTGEEGCSGA